MMKYKLLLSVILLFSVISLINDNVESREVWPVHDDYPRTTIVYHINHWDYTEIDSDFAEIKAMGWEGLLLYPVSVGFQSYRTERTKMTNVLDLALANDLDVVLLIYARMENNPSWFLWDGSYLEDQDGGQSGGDLFNKTWIDGYYRQWLVDIDDYYGGHAAVKGWYWDDTFESVTKWTSYNSVAKGLWADWLENKYGTLGVMKDAWRHKWANGTAAGASWYADWAAAGNDPPESTSTNYYAIEDWFYARGEWIEYFAEKSVEYINTNHTLPTIVESTYVRIDSAAYYLIGVNTTTLMNYFDGIGIYRFGGGGYGGQQTRVIYGALSVGAGLSAIKMKNKIVNLALDINGYDRTPTLGNIADAIIGGMSIAPEGSLLSFAAFAFNWSTKRMPDDYPDIWYNLPILIDTMNDGEPVGDIEIGVVLPRYVIPLSSGGTSTGILGLFQEAGFKVGYILEEDLNNQTYLNQFKLIVLSRSCVYYDSRQLHPLVDTPHDYWILFDWNAGLLNQTKVYRNSAPFTTAWSFTYAIPDGHPPHWVYIKEPTHPIANGLPNPFYLNAIIDERSINGPTGDWTSIFNWSTDAARSCLSVNTTLKVILSGLNFLGDCQNHLAEYSDLYKTLATNMALYTGCTQYNPNYSLWEDVNGLNVAVINSNITDERILTLPSTMRFIAIENITGLEVNNSLLFNYSRTQIYDHSNNRLVEFTEGSFIFDVIVGRYSIFEIATSFDYTISGRTATLTDSTIGYNLTYLWDFGDGSNSTSEKPIHTFASYGTYSVSLTVTDEYGATNTTSKNVFVTYQTIIPEETRIDIIDVVIWGFILAIILAVMAFITQNMMR